MNKSETEKAVLEAYSIFKSSLEATLGVKDLTVSVGVIGVKLSTLAVVVEGNDELELDKINNTGLFNDETFNYVELGEITLGTNRKKN